jgi:hypothetical protein
MYKVLNRTYVRSREHTVLVFFIVDARRVAGDAEVVPDVEDVARARSCWSRSRGTRDVEDGARA